VSSQLIPSRKRPPRTRGSAGGSSATRLYMTESTAGVLVGKRAADDRVVVKLSRAIGAGVMSSGRLVGGVAGLVGDDGVLRVEAAVRGSRPTPSTPTPPHTLASVDEGQFGLPGLEASIHSRAPAIDVGGSSGTTSGRPTVHAGFRVFADWAFPSSRSNGLKCVSSYSCWLRPSLGVLMSACVVGGAEGPRNGDDLGAGAEARVRGRRVQRTRAARL